MYEVDTAHLSYTKRAMRALASKTEVYPTARDYRQKR
jgi:hypothetical protein